MKQLMLVLSISLASLGMGCSVVQPVYKAPSANCTEGDLSGANNGCNKVDGIPYYLPRTSIKLQIPVTKTTETEPPLILEARRIYAKAENSDCTWDKTKENGTKPCVEEDFVKEFVKSNNCYARLEKEAEIVGVVIDDLQKGGNPKTVFKLGEIGISTEAEPDPEQLYFIELKGGKLKNET